ncbi:MAG: hypothetical protein LBL62_08500 [Planctomycetaceae bacterium]|jgi:hypothetical protein|nr:hypothetical protein [Planctomycetaceae bacterium]
MRNNPPQRGGQVPPQQSPCKGNAQRIGDFNPLPLQGEIMGGFNPPRCGGLLCNAPKGAEKTLQSYRKIFSKDYFLKLFIVR